MKLILTESEQKRFFSKFFAGESDDCWEWSAGKSKGYGRFWLRFEEKMAHIISYCVFIDEVPIGLKVLHHCDNPPCVNPNHLFIGTSKDNSEDMVRKGRYRNGREKPKSLVLQAREMYDSNRYTQKEIAETLGVSEWTVSLWGRRVNRGNVDI